MRGEFGGFTEPQGLVALGNDLYVADRAGQVVWRISADGARERVAGTGELADGRVSQGRAPDVDLRSPWGLAAFDGGVIVTMAGAHELWRLDPASLKLTRWAGTGGEDVVDGERLSALLAQPTGASDMGTSLAFADCESSAIRVAEGDEVRTVVGTGLFDFGDRDGTGDEVLLQHAEDLAHVAGGTLAVADTYNDRLKSVQSASRRVRPWPGEAGEAGALREPAGVSAWGETIAGADTGNHRVVLVTAQGGVEEVRFD